MIKNVCENHEWEKTGNYRVEKELGVVPTPFTCKRCNITMTASEIFQLEALENQTKALKDQARATSALVITTIVAFATLIIVAIGFYFDYIKCF